ncbi:unnamed protein product [Blepharisma stoltei]|uniref:FLYWCH-type domain-containing protein n=1 Tax=Blepharisma stoltei TaxID=1481888 RepID=A0AAU9ILN6_9CILI|nr:unnamed protein product [Blepharisma stoltei]
MSKAFITMRRIKKYPVSNLSMVVYHTWLSTQADTYRRKNVHGEYTYFYCPYKNCSASCRVKGNLKNANESELIKSHQGHSIASLQSSSQTYNKKILKFNSFLQMNAQILTIKKAKWKKSH